MRRYIGSAVKDTQEAETKTSKNACAVVNWPTYRFVCFALGCTFKIRFSSQVCNNLITIEGTSKRIRHQHIRPRATWIYPSDSGKTVFFEQVPAREADLTAADSEEFVKRGQFSRVVFSSDARPWTFCPPKWLGSQHGMIHTNFEELDHLRTMGNGWVFEEGFCIFDSCNGCNRWLAVYTVHYCLQWVTPARVSPSAVILLSPCRL